MSGNCRGGAEFLWRCRNEWKIDGRRESRGLERIVEREERAADAEFLVEAWLLDDAGGILQGIQQGIALQFLLAPEHWRRRKGASGCCERRVLSDDVLSDACQRAQNHMERRVVIDMDARLRVGERALERRDIGFPTDLQCRSAAAEDEHVFEIGSGVFERIAVFQSHIGGSVGREA